MTNQFREKIIYLYKQSNFIPGNADCLLIVTGEDEWRSLDIGESAPTIGGEEEYSSTLLIGVFSFCSSE